MEGGDGNDFLGSAGGTLYGGNGNDSLDGVFSILYGGSGNDYLRGSDSRVDGGDGDDEILGDEAVIIGGLGRDSLTGDTVTPDTFIYNTPSEGGDTINNFGGDRLQISASGFKGGLQPGELSSSQFVLGTSAQDSNDRFVFTQSTGALFYDVDGQGGSQQVQLAVLTGSPDLTASDFYIV